MSEVNPSSSIAILSSIAAVVGGILVKLLDIVLTKIRANNDSKAKDEEINHSGHIDDRGTVRQFIERTYKQIDRLEKLQDESNIKIDELHKSNADLCIQIAEIKALDESSRIMYAVDRALWDSERVRMQDRIQDLEACVTQLQAGHRGTLQGGA